MPFVAVVTIIGTAVTVLALAVYLISVALALRSVNARLGKINTGLLQIVERTEPVGPVVQEINRDIAGVNGALQEVLTKPRPAAAPPPPERPTGRPAYVVAAPGGGVLRERPSPPPPQGGLQRAASGPPAGVVSSSQGYAQSGEVGAAAAFASGGEYQPADMRWGIRPELGVRGVAQVFATFAGLLYVGIGVIGFFVTGFSNPTEYVGHKLFWIFGVTPFHNIVHIGVGAVWLIAALTLTKPAAEGVNFAIGGVYALAAILGYLGYLGFLGIGSHLDPDNPLHLATAVVSLLFAGLIRAPSSSRTMQYPVQAGAR